MTFVFDDTTDQRGYYGRLLGYIHEDGRNLNYDLVSTGNARVYDSTSLKADQFYTAESNAQTGERGLWNCRETPDSNGDSISIVQIHADATGNDNNNLNDEYVVLKNTGQDAVDLSEWTVSDESSHSYTFSSGQSLAGGESLTLHTGAGSNSNTDVYWGATGAVWNNGGDTVTVRTAEGNITTTKSH